MIDERTKVVKFEHKSGWEIYDGKSHGPAFVGSFLIKDKSNISYKGLNDNDHTKSNHSYNMTHYHFYENE